ncbi:hypothetical protein DL546_003154 [Coniochaeta pulveracea]|uniref:NADH-cytochrome b5 reductase n=1 Tax=Coniochaeta pulveracea TaxID=177199 RepID=A0A420XZ64_9PEZI|nr:hypothetical protein DL546_003154 [Coniochaeta pulveracea]
MATPLTITAAVAGLGAYAMYARNRGDSVVKEPFSSFGFHTLPLESSELANHNTKRLRFQLPDKEVKSGLSLTSAVLTITFPGGGWLPCIRPYTPTNDLNEKGFIELMVKRYPNGKQSSYLHSLKPGDSVLFAPIKEISWTPNKHAHVALIAGGAGITPMFQLVRGILGNPTDHTRITLVWGVNSDEDIFLKKELDELEHSHPNQFHAVYVVSHPTAESEHPKGYITKEVLENAGLGVKLRDSDGGGVKAFVCGPPAMEKALTGSKGFFGSPEKGVLHELGFKPGDVHRF